MNNLIYQTNITPHKKQPNHVALSQRGFMQYAKQHGADYMFNETPQLKDTGLKHPEYYERYQIIFDEQFDEYDKILYVDADVYPQKMNENIFELEGDILCMPERVESRGNFHPTFSVRGSVEWKEVHQTYLEHEIDITYFDDGQIRWYNTGVMVLSKDIRIEMRKKFESYTFFNPPKTTTKMFIHIDEMWWILMLTKHKMLDKVTELDNCWNWTGANAVNGNLSVGDFPSFANFLHFSGGRKKAMVML